MRIAFGLFALFALHTGISSGQDTKADWKVGTKESQTNGVVTVSVTGVSIGKALLKNDFGGGSKAAGDESLLISLEIAVKGRGAKVDFATWGETALDAAILPKITDDAGDKYRMVFPSGQRGLIGVDLFKTLTDGEKAKDLLVIQKPSVSAKTIYLTLPGFRAGESEPFRFSIDREAWTPKKVTPPVTTPTAPRPISTPSAGSVKPEATDTGTATTSTKPSEMTEEEKARAREAAGTILGFGVVTFIVLAILSIAFQMLPFVIAIMRSHNSTAAIFLLCFFLGWTCIGWFIALIWAFTGDTVANDKRRARYSRDD